MDRAFGQLYVHPVGHSTPGPRVGDDTPSINSSTLSSSSCTSSQPAEDLYLSFQGDGSSESQLVNATWQTTRVDNLTQTVPQGYASSSTIAAVNHQNTNILPQRQIQSPSTVSTTSKANQATSNTLSSNANVGSLLLQPCSMSQIWGSNGNMPQNTYAQSEVQSHTHASLVADAPRDILEQNKQSVSHSQVTQMQPISNQQLNVTENCNDYTTLSRQHEYLQTQMIREQEEQLLRRQQQIALILQQQEQQWQLLQQQKHALFSQHKTQNIALPQTQTSENPNNPEVSLQEQLHTSSPQGTAFINEYSRKQVVNSNQIEEHQLPIKSGFQNGPSLTSNSLQHNPLQHTCASIPKIQSQYQMSTCVDGNIKTSQDAYQMAMHTSHPTLMLGRDQVNILPSNFDQRNQPFPKSDAQFKSGSELNDVGAIKPKQQTNVTAEQSQLQSPQVRRKEIHPDNFDGSGTTEWPDYIIHFEQCADWNQWNNLQKAQMLSIHLKGEAQKLLSNLTGAQRNDYEKVKSILTDRYDPKEKEVTYRFQFRNSRREKGVTVSDFGYNLRKLSQKAYPDLTLDQLEVHVIEQFINGLGHGELQKHVQFRHPRTLNEAIGLATEFEALEGSLDRIKKPQCDESTVASIGNKHYDSQTYPSITLDQISKLIDNKLDKLLPMSRSREKSPVNQRDSSLSSKTEYVRSRSPESKSSSQSPVRPKPKVYCTYCKRDNHSFEDCWSRRSPRRRGGNSKETDTGSKSTYVITSQTFKRSKRVPSITITPPDTSFYPTADTVEQDLGTPESISNHNPMQTEDSNESHSSSNTFEKNLGNPKIRNSHEPMQNESNMVGNSISSFKDKVTTSNLKLLMEIPFKRMGKCLFLYK